MKIIKEHSNINYNKKNFDKLALKYHKKYGIMTYSCTLAIASILEYENFQDYILIPNNACFRVILPLIKNNKKIILINPKNGFFVTSQEYIDCLKYYKDKNIKISAIIIAYVDGVVINSKQIRKIFKGIIIEDISLIVNGKQIGLYSDYVVTSFGSYKAIELGYGGAIYTNIVDLAKIFDFEDYTGSIFLPYVFQKRINIPIQKYYDIAQSNNNKYHKKVDELMKIKNKDIIKELDFIGNNYQDCFCNKFYFTVKRNNYDRVIEILKKDNIIYSTAKEYMISEYEVVKKYNDKIIFNEECKKNKKIIIRVDETRNNSIKKFVKDINKMGV